MTRGSLTRALAVAAGGALALSAVVLWVDAEQGLSPALLATIVAVTAVGCGLWIIHVLADTHFGELERLRLSALAGALPPRDLAARKDEVGRMAQAIAGLAARGAEPDPRMAQVIGGLADGVVMLTPTGLVSLINRPGRAALGGSAAPGTSLFDVVWRDDLVAAIARAEAAGQPIRAELRTMGGRTIDGRVVALHEVGTLITFPGTEARWTPGIEHNFDLMEQPPAVRGPPDDNTALAALPVLSFDTETTGLDAGTDRIVAIGAVRLHGDRIYPRASLDRLVRPERRIPRSTTGVHGITDAMVANASAFAVHWPEIAKLMTGCVVIGHNIAFDLKLTRLGCERAGIAFVEPPWLCTLRLAEALDPGETAFDLEDVAHRHGVDPAGRHTALGDALLVAELYRRMVHRLAERGIVSLGQVRAFSERARRAIAGQRAQGWVP
ncbi:MAG: hypothetical protein FJX46_08330 [Alphaproteobacteria bacterium]|nr:hypothetical protein [Alphaproteobacteria bacterium]